MPTDRPPKPTPLAVFAAEFSSAENPPKKVRLGRICDTLQTRQVFFT